MDRRTFIGTVVGAFLVASPAAEAQQAAKVWRIGFLGPTSAAASATRIQALRAGLLKLGYIEGKNLVIEFRWADDNYDLLPRLAAELVDLKVDVIVTYGTPGTTAAKRATTTIPIVTAHVGDAVLTGLVANIAHPEGNITGSSFFNPELAAKRLELLNEALPGLRRIAVLKNPGNAAMEPVMHAMEQTAASLKLDLQQVGVRRREELDPGFAAMVAQRAEAVVIVEDAMLNGSLQTIAEYAAKYRLPSIGLPEYAEAGGFMAYGVDLIQMFSRAAVFVDKILKGVKISDLPVERATNFLLLINRRTAKALGLTIPPSLLLRANEVIQ
jgi:putative tryptophan/tyrosine transport system substrate-binding protein